MYLILRSLLFLFPAETAHHITMAFFSVLCKIPLLNLFVKKIFFFEEKSLETRAFGLCFNNPIGIAAGFDKDARYIRAMEYLGFGFVEVGTVTPLAQKGNARPRLFRLKKDQALINRMGFNNAGVDAMVNRLKNIKDKNIIIGGNIGKNKNTPLHSANEDYLKCFEKLYPYVDYFVVNVSSPNTPGLRSLQSKGPLLKILNALISARKQQDKGKAILLKISPDLSNEQLDEIIAIVNQVDIEGIVAANTTIERKCLKTSVAKVETIGNGGLSGFPLAERSSGIIRYLKDHLKDDKAIIGVGGVNGFITAQKKLDSGADLIQVYTGFIYKGPFLIKRIKKGLANNLKF